jgi:TonB-dependent receptor
MRVLKLLSVGLILSVALFAKGSVSVFIFKDGKPLANNEVKIDGRTILTSDSDGGLKVELPNGKHQIEIYGKDRVNLGYFKKFVTIKEGRDTQVIATFTSKGKKGVEVDTPRKAMKKEATKVEAKGKGRLSGRVVTTNDKKPIEGARVFVKGTAVDARTDANGRFNVEVPAGVALSISVVHSAYSSQTKGGIRVPVNGTGSVTVALTPASMELEEFVVLAPKVEGSIADIMMEEKKSNAIANILGSEEFSKKGDSSAAGALKRVTGITLVGGKNIYIRGLGERYSNIEMNSMPLPSPDPTKRVVPLDIFPSSVIGSLKVQKSASADIPSSFGGGYIDIRTKDSSRDKYIKVSLGVKGNSDLGAMVDNYQGSSDDWTGYDNGYRDIPQQILDAIQVKVGERVPGFTTDYFTKEELAQFTRDYLSRNYNTYKWKLPMGYSVAIEGATNYTIKEDHKINIFANYRYSQEFDFREEAYFGYDMGSDGTLHTTPDKNGTNYKTNAKYSHGGILNIGYNYLDILKLKYTKLYTLNSEKSTRIVDGIMGSNYDHLTKYYLDWEERELNVDQISGEFDYKIWNMASKFQFGLEHATATLNQPNNFHYAYINVSDGAMLDNYISNHIANQLTSEDTLDAFYLKNKHFIDWYSKEDFIEYGINYSTKERISRQNKYFLRKLGGRDIDDSYLSGSIEYIYDAYVRGEIDYDERLFIVSPIFKPADYFDAEVEDKSFFISSLIKPTDKLEIMAGVKYVNFKQTIYQYKEDRENPDMAARRLIQKLPEELEVKDFYPSFSIKYKHSDKHHFDAAFSKTYIVPDLREFTSGEYFHPYDVATVLGNPDLENTDIYSVDLKYSYYFSDKEALKVGLFYKYLEKPIEDVMIPSSSLPIYSFDNAESATLYGIEFDGRKNLDFISKSMANFYISGNFSYTDSDVTLREEQLDTFSTNHRQLQGLSQLVVNLTLGYETDNRSLALSYNKMGERIRKVGLIDAGDKYPDNYEIPPHLLDFVWIEKFNSGLTFKVKFGNILDDETVWKQGENITKQFKKGRDFSFGISYKY